MNEAGNPWTDRDPEEVARDAENRLRVKALKALLKANAAERVVEEFEKLLADPTVKKRTKASVARSYASYLKSLVPTLKNEINLNQQNVALTAADLLQLASSNSGELPNKALEPNGDSTPELPAPNEDLQPASRPSEPITDEVDALLAEIQDEPTEGHGRALSIEATETASAGDERKEDPSESLGGISGTEASR